MRQTDIPPHAVCFTSHAPHFDQRRLAASRRTPKPSNTDCTLTQIGERSQCFPWKVFIKKHLMLQVTARIKNQVPRQYRYESPGPV